MRLSGPDAARIAGELVGHEAPFEPRHATFCRLATSAGRRPSSRGPPSLLATSVPPEHLRPSRRPPSLLATSVPLRIPRPRPGLSVRAVRDQVVVVFFPAPQSYTGEDVVEISAHGSPVVLGEIIRAAVARRRAAGRARRVHAARVSSRQARSRAGRSGRGSHRRGDAAAGPRGVRSARRHADDGDWRRSRRSSSTVGAARGVARFSRRGLSLHRTGRSRRRRIARVRQRIDELLAGAARGRLVREGAQVAIVGAPNVGKSSLFNALLNANRAIVTPMPGTTRDLLTERADVARHVDRAGRYGRDPRERRCRRTGRRAARASGGGGGGSRAAGARSIAAGERGRRGAACRARRARTAADRAEQDRSAGGVERADAIGEVVDVSVLTGEASTRSPIAWRRCWARATERRDQPLVTNMRHAALLERARDGLTRALDALARIEGHDSGGISSGRSAGRRGPSAGDHRPAIIGGSARVTSSSGSASGSDATHRNQESGIRNQDQSGIRNQESGAGAGTQAGLSRQVRRSGVGSGSRCLDGFVLIRCSVRPSCSSCLSVLRAILIPDLLIDKTAASFRQSDSIMYLC